MSVAKRRIETTVCIVHKILITTFTARVCEANSLNKSRSDLYLSLRKEVIQPHLPVRLPCYDFTPLTKHTFGGALLAVRLPTSGVLNSGGVTGGVYKARERIHRAVLMRDY